MNHTLPPGVSAAIVSARSIWSARDEAALQDLLDRKQRIMSQHKEKLADVLGQLDPAAEVPEGFLLAVIAVAEPLRDALAPFDGRGP
jgi:hypothetical protein